MDLQQGSQAGCQEKVLQQEGGWALDQVPPGQRSRH